MLVVAHNNRCSCSNCKTKFKVGDTYFTGRTSFSHNGFKNLCLPCTQEVLAVISNPKIRSSLDTRVQRVRKFITYQSGHQRTCSVCKTKLPRMSTFYHTDSRNMYSFNMCAKCLEEDLYDTPYTYDESEGRYFQRLRGMYCCLEDCTISAQQVHRGEMIDVVADYQGQRVSDSLPLFLGVKDYVLLVSNSFIKV